MNFDNLTLYDKALLYQAIQDIPGKPFSIENMIKIEEGCAKYEEDLFKEKQALHVLTTGKDLSDLIKQAIEAIDPTLIVSSYHGIDGYIVSVSIVGHRPLLIIDEYDKLSSEEPSGYTLNKIKHLVGFHKVRVVPIKEAIKVLNSEDSHKIYEWALTYDN